MKLVKIKNGLSDPTHKSADDLITRGYPVVAGVDEVGRGAWAGPVVAAAIILSPKLKLAGVRDSKLLSLSERQRLVPQIKRQAVAIGIGWSSAAEIDYYGLTWAVSQSGIRALTAMRAEFSAVILDGNHNYLSKHCYSETQVKADQTCLSVAAASIIAKVARDNYMRYYHRLWPQYGWQTNVGYGTSHHQAAIKSGLSPLHRRLFKPVAMTFGTLSSPA